MHGTDASTAIEFAHNELTEENGQLVATATDRTETIETGLVLRAIGYRGEPIAGLPFDERRGTVPSEHGRVIDAAEPVPGVYVSGWIKRGPRGVIGSNRVDAEETVEAVIADFIAGKLTTPTGDRAALRALLAQRQPDLVDRKGWKTIDQAEKTAGKAAGRPRVKFTTRADLLKAAKG